MICKVVAERSLKEASKKLQGFCEWRLDFLDELNFKEIKRIVLEKKLILTLRPEWSGGRFKDEEKRIEYLKKIIELTPFYVDLELETENIETLTELARKCNVKFILSYHDFKKTPSLEKLHLTLRKSQEFMPSITKIVAMANSLEDNLKILKFNLEAESKIVSFCMGEFGKLSRIFCPFFGSEFTYAGEIAPGQLSFESLEKIFEILGDFHDRL
ncbi:MAG: type I 3-dehydroquinate dehydratase, partial [Candidatus Methanofastidiosia archaeon]